VYNSLKENMTEFLTEFSLVDFISESVNPFQDVETPNILEEAMREAQIFETLPVEESPEIQQNTSDVRDVNKCEVNKFKK
jgi:hypothetical protein